MHLYEYPTLITLYYIIIFTLPKRLVELQIRPDLESLNISCLTNNCHDNELCELVVVIMNSYTLSGLLI